jgi:hypothetical protein
MAAVSGTFKLASGLVQAHSSGLVAGKVLKCALALIEAESSGLANAKPLKSISAMIEVLSSGIATPSTLKLISAIAEAEAQISADAHLIAVASAHCSAKSLGIIGTAQRKIIVTMRSLAALTASAQSKIATMRAMRSRL